MAEGICDDLGCVDVGPDGWFCGISGFGAEWNLAGK
jgi:hypothetical protein